MTVGNIDDHLDEVLGIIEKPQKEVVKVEKVKPPINGQDEDCLLYTSDAADE